MTERVYCLYRVSTTKQVDHDEMKQADIPVQRKDCREFAEKMGWTIIREEQENGISGFKVSATDRDSIQLIKEHAEEGKFDILLVFMFDRIGRRAEETPFVVEWLIEHGIRVWSVNEGEQRLESHTDRLTNYIRFWQADGESQKTAIRTRVAMEQMVMEGRYRGGGVPYGYRLENTGILNKRKKEISRLVIDEDEARIVKQIFNYCAYMGYGKFRITKLLNERGIKNRAGKNWHDATIGNILHNIAYTGVLRSGKAYSEPIPELQIIDQATYDLVQKLLAERSANNQDSRTKPLNTAGQSLLSGNIFCGHCGGRLTLTTSGTVRKNAAGVDVHRKRIRYICYNKTRMRCDCNGPTGYTMHLLDDKVVDLLHYIFDRMKAVSREDIIDHAHKKTLTDLESNIKTVRNDFIKATRDYDNLKQEILKSVQGESNFDTAILAELSQEAKAKMDGLSQKLTDLNKMAEESEKKLREIEATYDRIIKWSEIFDESDMAVKKMAASYIIDRVYVSAGYNIHYVLNLTLQQFELGLDDTECVQIESDTLPEAVSV